ncbi:hypothetical protein [Streptomyces sp. NPDC126933]
MARAKGVAPWWAGWEASAHVFVAGLLDRPKDGSSYRRVSQALSGR